MSIALPEMITGSGHVLLLCDHASNGVPADIALGVSGGVMERHVAVDIGAGPLTRALAARLGAPAILATVSRLVIDLHRPSDHPGLIPLISDGHAVPGNIAADRPGRIARFHAPYHRAIGNQMAAQRPALVAAIHSFTPCLEQGGTPRPWEIGILYNRDTRAARLALEAFRGAGVVTGDNQPYSGRDLNMTLNRHAEGQGVASLAIEVRNDLIADPAGAARWAVAIAPVLADIAKALARRPKAGT